MRVAFSVAIALVVATSASSASPIEKVITLIGDLETKIIAEGEAAQKTYAEFAEWCEDESKNVMFEIKTGKADVADLKATIEKESANIQSQTTKIEELASAIATDEADLKAATEIRDKEAAVFSAAEADLVETIDTLERAVGIIEKEMSGGASMMQLKKAGNVVQTLALLVQAQSLSAADGKKLAALVQSSQESGDDDVGAPDAAVFKSSSSGVVDTLNDLLEKAQNQLEESRQQEQTDLQNFQLLKQSLEDEIKFANKEMDSAKKSKSGSEEGRANAEGDLSVTTKDLTEDLNTLGGLHHDCMTKAQDFEASTKSRGEELKALATAKQIIKESTGGAADQSYSLLQVSLRSHTDLANFEVVRFIRDLAKKQKSSMLAQLASRMSSTVRFSSASSEDIFGKVKGLIQDMIEKLEAEAEESATKKAFCDKELAESNAKQDDKTDEIEKLTAKIDKMTAQSTKLKAEVATLQSELATLTGSQAEMDKLRATEHAAWEEDSAEMEKGLNGVKLALKVLNEYYAKTDKAHASQDGASSGIIGLLEVCESDFSKGLAEMNEAEKTSQVQYEQETKENEIARVTKEQAVKYKTKESTGLDQSVAETESDKGNVQAELAAVQEYLKKIEAQCIAKAETYAERKAHRDAEIAGLKEGLQILESETALIQTSKRTLRGTKKHN